MPLSGRHILIVEDEPLIALDLALAFQTAGATGTCATSIRHALDIIAQSPPDGCVLDMQLWDKTFSDEIADALRASGIPFVMFTAFKHSPAGALLHLAKPAPASAAVKAMEDHFRAAAGG
mgnify:CR=1 FL=1